MAVGLIHDDLVSLPGVESADLDGDSTAPSGVRVRLAPGVDAAAVGDQVQRVLALHGLRSEIEVAPQAPSPVVPMPGRAGLGFPETSAVEPRSDDDAGAERQTEGDVLDSLTVTEGRHGVAIEARAGETISRVRAAGSAGPAVDQAVASAVGELLGTRTSPLVHSVDTRDLDDVVVLTVVIEEAGERLAGSAVVEGGRAYALGRAVWVALSTR